MKEALGREKKTDCLQFVNRFLLFLSIFGDILIIIDELYFCE